jgi:hypothetical protein
LNQALRLIAGNSIDHRPQAADEPLMDTHREVVGQMKMPLAA